MAEQVAGFEVLGPWSLDTSRRFWEGFTPAALADQPTGPVLRTVFCAEEDWRRACRCRPFLEGGAFMIAWMLGFLAGPILLAGFAVYLCRGPRRHRRLTRERIAEVQVLADLERHENLL
jgi:hypothetical protein